MDEAQLIALVLKAISLHQTRGCLEYVNENLEVRLQRDLRDVGSLPAIRQSLVRHALSAGGIEFRVETRVEYRSRREFWFRVLVPISGRTMPLFYELELVDDDEDCPSVLILNVHF